MKPWEIKDIKTYQDIKRHEDYYAIPYLLYIDLEPSRLISYAGLFKLRCECQTSITVYKNMLDYFKKQNLQAALSEAQTIPILQTYAVQAAQPTNTSYFYGFVVPKIHFERLYIEVKQ